MLIVRKRKTSRGCREYGIIATDPLELIALGYAPFILLEKANLAISRENRRRVVTASNALFTLWSRNDDPKRQQLVDTDQDDLRRVITEREHLLVICRELWRPKWK